MLIVLLLATALAAPGLNRDLIWFDELTSIGHAGGLTGPFSFTDVLESVKRASPKHTPLFFELLSLWAGLVGWHHAPLRCLSLFWGLIGLAWIYRIGRDFLGPRAGLYAGALLGLNVFWLDYFHDIKMYSMLTALLAAMTWHYLFLTRAKTPAKRRHWLGLMAFAAGALYTQPYSIFLFAAIGVYHLFFLPKTRRWLQVALAFGAVGILYLPWLEVTILGLNTRFDTFDAMPLGEALAVFAELFSNGSGLLMLLPIALALWQMRDPLSRARVMPILALGTAVFVLILLVNEAIGLIPLRRARYFFVSWGLLSLIVGFGLAGMRRWQLPVISLALYMAFGLHLRGLEHYPRYQGTVYAVAFYPPLHDYVAALRGHTRTQDFVVGFTDANFVNHRGKHGKSTADYYLETLLGIDGAFVPTHFSPQQLERDIPQKLDNHPYLLFTYDPRQPPDVFELTQSLIERDYQLCGLALDQPDLWAQRYVTRVLSCERDYQPIHFENGVSIVDRYGELLIERGLVRLVTGWEVADELLGAYNLSIQLQDGGGNKLDQIDRHLDRDILKWFAVELPTAQLPPGDYRAVVIVYDRDPPHAKVAGRDLRSGQTGKIFPIFAFSLAE